MTNQLIECDCGRKILDIDIMVGPFGQIECEHCHKPALAFITTDILADLKLKWEIERINQHPDYLVINGKRHYVL